MQAVNEKIIVEELGVDKTEGGVSLPDGSTYDTPGYRVVSVGKGRLTADGSRVPLCVEVGDYLLVVSANQAAAFKWQGKSYFVIQEGGIGAIIKKADYDEQVAKKKIEIV